MKVYFDERGHIKEVIYDSVIATSHNDVKIEAYADFDVSPYTVSITLKRPDGFTLGPYPMLPKSIDDKIYHEYSLTKADTKISGEMQATIRYEIYQLTEEGELELTYSKPAGMITFVIFEAVNGDSTGLVEIDARLDKLEKAIKDMFDNVTGIVSELEQQVGDIEQQVGDIEQQVGDIEQQVGDIDTALSNILGV